MLKTTLAAESFIADLLEQNEVETIFYESMEEETLNKLLNDEETEFIKESLESFIGELPQFIKAFPQYFLGESKEEVESKIYAFAKHAIKGYLEEIGAIESILPEYLKEIEESVLSESDEITEEELSDILSEQIKQLFERAKSAAIAKGLGAVSLLDEISKTTLKKAAKVAGGLAAAAGAVGAGVVAAKKLEDEGEEALKAQAKTMAKQMAQKQADDMYGPLKKLPGFNKLYQNTVEKTAQTIEPEMEKQVMQGKGELDKLKAGLKAVVSKAKAKLNQ